MFRSMCALALVTTSNIVFANYEENPLDVIVVTAIREAKPKSELPEAVTVLNEHQIQSVAPSHPADLLNRVPGVYINQMGGEGHMTSIRQPLTTAGVYLFLEDGIPTRPTGYFNHNGLYEVNIPQASSVEVTRGPGSALYGSDAIGGIINSLTAAPPALGDDAGFDVETGSDGWKRALLSAGSRYALDAGIIAQFNSTDSDGFREDDDYERQSASLRWDTPVTDNTSAKTILVWNDIDQSGSSGLFVTDYHDHPEENYYRGDIARREVYALRLSSEFTLLHGDRETFSITPFYRDNQMDLMPSWMLSFDPQQYTTDFQSYGLLTKYRLNLPDIHGQLITGVDIDTTPSSYEENQLVMTKIGNEYISYAYTGRCNYDFEAQQHSISPYAHFEWEPADKIRASLGLRYDAFEVEYNDRLPASVPEIIGFRRWYRPDDQTTTYEQWSPKLGLVYNIHARHNLYTNYRHAFRVPTAGQLFRSGSNINSDQLDPVRSDSIEIGARGQLLRWLGYEVAAYHMKTKDDIVNYIDSSVRYITNAGETRHDGIEMSLSGDISNEWGFEVAWTWTRQTYEDFSYVCGVVTCNWAGNDIMQAPQSLGHAALSYEPVAWRALRLELELEHMGRYYIDQTNTDEYDGHNLLNLRARYQINTDIEVYARVQNITDRRYSTSTSMDPVNGVEYRPGQPLGGFVGFRYHIR